MSTQSLRCSTCSTPYHEASGHRFSNKTVICGPCARKFCRWVKGMMSKRWGKEMFYKHAYPPGEKPSDDLLP